MKKTWKILSLLLLLPLAIFSQNNPPSNVTATALSYDKVRISWDTPEGTTAPTRLNLFNQADLITHYGAGARGADVSALYGGQGSYGNNVRKSSHFWIADDFSLNATAQISKMTFFAYETGASADSSSTFTEIYVQIFDHQPTATSVPIWGDTITNRIADSYWTGIYRTTATALTNTERPIMAIEANINTQLAAGTYWVAFAVENDDSSKTIWATPRCDLEQVSTGNAMQFSNGEWTAWTDGTSLEQMGMPLTIQGSFVNENLIGFNIYRDGNQLNSTLIHDFYFTEDSLQANTFYCYSVEAVYANGTTVSSSEACTETPLDPCIVIAFPYEENFDEYGTGTSAFPDCWTRYSSSTSLPYINTTNYSGAGSLYLQGSSSYYTMVFSPQLGPELSMNETYIEFMFRKTSTAYNVIVGIVDHPDSLNTFVVIDTITPSATSTWEQASIWFDNYQGTGKYIAFKSGGAASNFIYIDNFVWKSIPACRQPLSISTNTNSNSLTIEWTPANNTSEWTLEYRTDIMEPWTVVENLNTPSYTITGLSANTEYNYLVRVKTICEDGESEYLENEITVTTACAAISELPYSEGFNTYGTGSTAHADCWISAPENYSYYPYVSTTNNGGVGSYYFYSTSTTTTIASFELDNSIDLSRLFMTFDLRSTSLNYTCEIGVMTNPMDTNTFVAIDTFRVSTINTWERKRVNFDSYVGNGHYIAIRSKNNTTNNFYIDNLYLSETISCATPENLTMVANTTSSITVAWEGIGNNIVSYELEYTNLSDSSVVTITNIPDTFYTVNNLEVNTYYEFKVRTLCDDASNSYWSFSETFRTSCGYINEFPSVENFDSYVATNGSFPDCWTRPSTYTSGTTVAPYIVNAYKVSAPNSLRLQSNYAWAATAPINADINTLQISFMYNKEGASSGTLEVGVMSNPMDTSTFELVGVVDATTFKDWHFAEFSLDSVQLSGTGHCIAFRQNTTSTIWYYWIDDVTIDYIPTCPRPQNVTATNITSNSANISWTASNNASSWAVRYKDTDQNEWTEISTNDTTITLTGLNANTFYEVEVKSYCNVDESYYSMAYTFATECGAINSFPYSNSFDRYSTGTSAFPTCWNRFYSTTGNYPYISTTNFSDPGSLYMYATSTNYSMAILPLVDSTINLNTLSLSLMMRTANLTYEVIVGVLEDPSQPTSFVPVDTLKASVTNTWEEKYVSFANYQGSNHYIAFRSNKGTSYVDNVVLNIIQTCFKPENVRVVNKTQTSIDIAWERGTDETEWEIAYKPIEATEWIEITSVMDTFYTFNNLQPNTTYTIKIRSNCSGDVTEYTYPIEGTTLCEPRTTLPYVENFDTYETGTTAYPDCWNKISTNTTPYITSTNFSAPGSLYLSGTASNAVYAILPPLEETIDLRTLKLTFKGRIGSASTLISVGTMSNPLEDSTFHLLEAFSLDATSTWEDLTLYLLRANETDRYIAFKSHATFYIDNLVLAEAESCIAPQRVMASQVTSNSATLSWEANEGDYDFEFICAEEGTEINNIIPTSTYDNPLYLSDLDPETTYNFYVRTICSNGEASEFSQVTTFTTLCAPKSIPYSNGFNDDGVGTDAYPSCWMKLGNGTNYIHATNKFSGIGGLYLYTTASTYAVAILPEFEIDVNQLQLNFLGKFTNLNYFVEIGVMTDPADTSTFEIIERINPRTIVWNSFSVPFSSYQGNGRYIAIRSQSNTSNYFYMDNVVVDFAPGCVKPSNIIAENITLTTADIDWRNGNSETAWEIAYGPSGFNPNVVTADVTIEQVQSHPHTITNLTSGTIHDVYIRSLCGGDDGNSEWTAVYSFRTDCDDISQLPYVENFDSYGTGTSTYLSCWERISSVSSTTQYPYISTTNNSAPGSLYFYSTANNYTIATLPAIASSIPMDTLQAQFKLRKTSASYKLIIGVMSNPFDRNTFVAIDTLTPSTTSTWEEFEVFFTSYTGNGRHIAFLSEGTSSNTIYLDDFKLSYVPSCFAATNINANNISSSSATLSWTSRSSASSWNIEYGLAGFTQGQGTMVTVTSNPYTLTGLTSGTLYDVYIQCICGPNDLSEWSDTYTFATECDPISLPYTEDFDSYTGTAYNTAGTTPLCWTTITNNTSYPAPHVIGSGSYWYPNSTPNALVFTTGTAGNEAIAVLPKFNTTATELDLAFAYRMESATNGVLTVGYVTDMNNISTSFTTIETITSFSVVTLDTILVSNLPTNARLAFRWTHNASFYSCNIDDIYVGEHITPVTPCDAPTNVVATPTQTTANVTWTSNASAWVVEYKEATATNWTASAQLSTPSYTIEGLTAATDYVVRVKSICENENESDWSAEVPFTTLPADIATYTITASASGPGTITPNGTITVQEGDNATFTFAANANAVVAQVLVDAAAITTPTDNSYTFSNVVANHTIEVVFEEDQTGINDMNMDATVALFPNPATSEINIQMADTRFVGSTMQVYDVYGKLITTSEIISQSVRLDVSAWANGVYIVRINSNEGIVTKRFVKR